MNIYLIISLALNIILCIDAWWLATQLKEVETKLKKVEKELITPVAEVKAEFSEEDMIKIKEMLKEASKNKYVMKQAEDLPVQCDHTYDSIVLIDDPVLCREKLVFHCRYCNHEEIIPIERGLMMDFVMGGGKT